MLKKLLGAIVVAFMVSLTIGGAAGAEETGSQSPEPTEQDSIGGVADEVGVHDPEEIIDALETQRTNPVKGGGGDGPDLGPEGDPPVEVKSCRGDILGDALAGAVAVGKGGPVAGGVGALVGAGVGLVTCHLKA